MAEAELFTNVITNLPNFIFGVVCVAILYKQNQKLLEMLDRECERNSRSSSDESERE